MEQFKLRAFSDLLKVTQLNKPLRQEWSDSQVHALGEVKSMSPEVRHPRT